MANRKKNEVECAVCYAVHDDEIHEATLRIHQWFYAQVTHHFEEDEIFTPLDERAAS